MIKLTRKTQKILTYIMYSGFILQIAGVSLLFWHGHTIVGWGVSILLFGHFMESHAQNWFQYLVGFLRVVEKMKSNNG